MDIERSRNGFYTVTFFNKNNLDEKDIRREFSTVGNVCRIIQNFQRVFIRFREKEEAERAIIKFGKIYDVDMAKNNKNSQSDQSDSGTTRAGINNPPNVSLPSTDSSSITLTSEKVNQGSKVFHLILGNLPKNYTVKDVHALVEEAKPVCINHMDETRVFSVRFCHIVLDSFENLSYLIDKLNGFVICGEKLIATEAKNLLEWREKAGVNKEKIGYILQLFIDEGNVMTGTIKVDRHVSNGSIAQELKIKHKSKAKCKKRPKHQKNTKSLPNQE